MAPETERRARATLQASAMSIDPGNPSAPTLVKQGKQAWHTDAWKMYDLVGEVKGGGRFMESAASRVKIALAIIPALGVDPVPLSNAVERGLISGAPDAPPADEAVLDPVVNAADVAIAEELTASLIYGQESEGALLGGWAVKSFVVGEAWVVGIADPVTGTECFYCVSTDELVLNEKAGPGQSKVLLRRMPNSGSDGLTMPGEDTPSDVVIPADAVMFRVWRRHARYGHLSDSNLHGCLTECNELRILDASIQASGLSRVSAGVMIVANDIEPRPVALEPDEDDESENPQLDPLLVEIVKHVTAPIAEPGSASAVAPFLMRGPAKVDDVPLKDLIFKLDLGRTLDPEVVTRCNYLRDRIAATLELPADRITGTTSDSNHWTAWLIDEETYRLYVAPTVQPMLDALTTKYLRARLVSSGVAAEVADRFIYIADAMDLVTRPNAVANAEAGHSGLVISNEAYRTALGFTDDDAPTPDEILKRIIERQTVLPDAVVPLLAALYGIELPEVQAVPGLAEAAGAQGDPNPGTGPNAPTNRELPPAPEAPPPDGEPGPPATDAPAPDNVVASVGAPTRAAQRLMNIDRRLRTRLLVAADLAVQQAVTRAGSKLRSVLAGASTPGNPKYEARAEFANVANRDLLHAMGWARIQALGTEPEGLFANEFDDLEERWDDWLAGAQDEVVGIASQTLGVDPDGEAIAAFRTKQDTNRKVGWAVLSAGLIAAARSAAIDPHPNTGGGGIGAGEAIEGVVTPGLIRQALAVAGGSNPVRGTAGSVRDATTGGFAGGVATGDDVAGLWGAYGQPWTGFEWSYNYAGPNPFEQHVDLTGVQFAADDDPVLATDGTGAEWVGPFFFPGDHDGCQCDAVPVWE